MIWRCWPSICCCLEWPLSGSELFFSGVVGEFSVILGSGCSNEWRSKRRSCIWGLMRSRNVVRFFLSSVRCVSGFSIFYRSSEC